MKRPGAFVLAWAALLAAIPLAVSPRASAMVETPMYIPYVATGRLPPIEDRLPERPAIEEGDPGQPGGELHTLIGSPRDTRLLAIIGYARLVAYMPDYRLVPDILIGYEVEDQRIFTFHLRPGMRWSDGAPFTTEDFRYWWEDVALNKELSPTGPPMEMLHDGEAPKVEILDPLTVRYSWSKPNPNFLPRLAGPTPVAIYRPAHYLRQFHAKYADAAALAALVNQYHARNWAALHNRMDNPIRNDNPDLPSLDPWVLRTRPPAERFVFERNPYYYRIDRDGQQLPYIDRVIASVADPKIIPVKTGAGESDLQARYIRFSDYTFLKAGEARGGYHVRLWHTGYGSELALYPNLTVKDPVWRTLLRDVRFRRALSLGIDRHEINNVIYYGLGLEGQNTMLPRSPLYDPTDRSAWSRYDPAEANRLLDEIGLTRRDGEGIRLLPDGRAAVIIVEYTGGGDQSDMLELIRDTWADLGIKLLAKPMQIELLHNRLFDGSAMMTLDKGLENGVATAAMAPFALAPREQEDWEWPRWGQYFETHGMAGEKPDLPEAQHLLDLASRWSKVQEDIDRDRIWREMLKIQADQVFTIGTVANIPQPLVVDDAVRNVPAEGTYNFDPGALLGVYKPDHFWIDADPGS